MPTGFIKVDINKLIAKCEGCKYCMITEKNDENSDLCTHFCKKMREPIYEVVNRSFHINSKAVECEVSE